MADTDRAGDLELDQDGDQAAPMIVWEESDRLLSGGTVSVRAVGLTEPDEVRTAVAITLQVDATQCQVSTDGTVTMTMLVAPAEALGVSRWLREAAVSLDEVGRPLFEWPATDSV